MRSIVAAFGLGLAGLLLSGCLDEGSYSGPSRYPVAGRDYRSYDRYERGPVYDRYDRVPTYDLYDRPPPRRYDRYDRYPPAVYDRPRAYRQPIYERPDGDRSTYDPPRRDRRDERRIREAERFDRDRPPVRPEPTEGPRPYRPPTATLSHSNEGTVDVRQNCAQDPNSPICRAARERGVRY